MAVKNIKRRKFIYQSFYFGGAIILPWNNYLGKNNYANNKLLLLVMK